MKAYRLYETKTMQELVALQNEIANDPSSKSGATGISIYNRQAQRKLDDIAQAIAMHLADQREARGYPVVCDGYSGRQTNKRR